MAHDKKVYSSGTARSVTVTTVHPRNWLTCKDDTQIRMVRETKKWRHASDVTCFTRYPYSLSDQIIKRLAWIKDKATSERRTPLGTRARGLHART